MLGINKRYMSLLCQTISLSKSWINRIMLLDMEKLWHC